MNSFMNDNKNIYYNPEQLRKLRERGVIIPDLSSVRIGMEVSAEKFSSGSILHPYVRINGCKTEIHKGAQIGVYGPVTMENSWIGENAVVGRLA